MPGGRKSAYYDKVEPRLDEVRKWRIDDAQSEPNIAKLLNISYRSLMEYKVKFPQFAQVLKESKENLILKLEQTLFQEAMGINSKAETIEEVWELNRRTGQMELIKKTVKKNRNPNITALLFALKNLDSTKWRDRRVLDAEESNDNEVAKNIETLAKIIGDDDELS